MHHIHAFLQDESGVTAIEYGLLAAMISIPIIVAAEEVGEELSRIFFIIERTIHNAVR